MYLQIFNPFLHLILLVTLSVAILGNGHIDTPCQHLVVHNFTPCFNLVTGSSANGSSPYTECCSELNKLSHSDVDCACLLLIGTIPAQLSFLRSLQAVLPRSCNVSGVPLQCKGYGTPLPAPGPGLSAPPDHSSAAAPIPRGPARTGMPTAPAGAETPRSAGQQLQPVLSPASSDTHFSRSAAVFTLWCLIALVTGFLAY